ncbi:hypothetical protein MP228_008103 [Amoeboaphelidium protococcarum]|nr:hypothetical protein MP228_008103 [Amoeboaphelidium protococcarum]
MPTVKKSATKVSQKDQGVVLRTEKMVELAELRLWVGKTYCYVKNLQLDSGRFVDFKELMLSFPQEEGKYYSANVKRVMESAISTTAISCGLDQSTLHIKQKDGGNMVDIRCISSIAEKRQSMDEVHLTLKARPQLGDTVQTNVKAAKRLREDDVVDDSLSQFHTDMSSSCNLLASNSSSLICGSNNQKTQSALSRLLPLLSSSIIPGSFPTIAGAITKSSWGELFATDYTHYLGTSVGCVEAECVLAELMADLRVSQYNQALGRLFVVCFLMAFPNCHQCKEVVSQLCQSSLIHDPYLLVDYYERCQIVIVESFEKLQSLSAYQPAVLQLISSCRVKQDLLTTMWLSYSANLHWSINVDFSKVVEYYGMLRLLISDNASITNLLVSIYVFWSIKMLADEMGKKTKLTAIEQLLSWSAKINAFLPLPKGPADIVLYRDIVKMFGDEVAACNNIDLLKASLSALSCESTISESLHIDYTKFLGDAVVGASSKAKGKMKAIAN